MDLAIDLARGTPRPAGPVQPGLEAAARLLAREFAEGDRRAAARMALRCVAAPQTSLLWLTRMEALRGRAGIERLPFELLIKPGQDFLMQGLSSKARSRLLLSHFHGLETAFGAVRTGRLILGDDFVVPLTEDLFLSLGRRRENRREGELHLRLRRERGDTLASLALVCGALDLASPADLWIGGLQGRPGGGGKAEIIAATKVLCGLRPKDLLLHAALAFADRLGLRDIRATSNARHVHAGPDGRSWAADYDAFWIELGGHLAADGVFTLPRSRRRRSEAEVAAGKRKAWRARYRLIDRMVQEVARL